MPISDFRKKKLLYVFNVFFGKFFIRSNWARCVCVFFVAFVILCSEIRALCYNENVSLFLNRTISTSIFTYSVSRYHNVVDNIHVRCVVRAFICNSYTNILGCAAESGVHFPSIVHMYARTIEYIENGKRAVICVVCSSVERIFSASCCLWIGFGSHNVNLWGNFNRHTNIDRKCINLYCFVFELCEQMWTRAVRSTKRTLNWPSR